MQKLRGSASQKQQRRFFNFNDVTISERYEGEDGPYPQEPFKLNDNSTASTDGRTLVYFKNLEDHLVRFIQEADVVVGCVAWVTSEPILKALAKKKGVSLVVQKEDFLRPDLSPHDNWKRQLRQLYDNLPHSLNAADLPGLFDLKENSDDVHIVEPIRCVGDANIDKLPACPRSHHKFVLFCKAEEHCQCNKCQEQLQMEMEVFELKSRDIMHISPYAVWTGSFNFTRNATMSFENAVVLYDAKLVEAYYQEYGEILFLSEPLDWTKPWMNPRHYFIAPMT